MAIEHGESVADRKNLLSQEDHMRTMERIELTVVEITRPTPSVARVAGRIATADVAAWRRPNLAIRLEVETPAGQRPVSRVYTIRSFDEARSVVEIDFVLHEDDSPAMRWLRAAKAGSTINLIGPRPHFLPDFAAGKSVAIFADETAIPALFSILQAWQPGVHGVAYVETADAAAFAELPKPADVELHLLLRGADEAPGTTGRLVEAAKALANPQNWTVWAAGERQEARFIRDHFTGTCGLSKAHAQVVGYWRRGMTSSEIDRLRLKQYEDTRARGGVLENLDDLDVMA